MQRKVCCFMIIFMLISSNVMSAYASATTSVTVAGGTIATGGLNGGYSAKTEAVAITLVMTMIRSLGVTVHLTQEAIEAGQTAYTVIRGKFREWCGETEGSSALQPDVEENIRDKFEVINGGSSSDPDGKLYFTPGVVKIVQNFLNWLKSTNQIQDEDSSGTSTGTVNGTYYGSRLSIVANMQNNTQNTLTEFISTFNTAGTAYGSETTKNAAWCAFPLGMANGEEKVGLFCYIPKVEGNINMLYYINPTRTPNWSSTFRQETYGNWSFVMFGTSNNIYNYGILKSNLPSDIYVIPEVQNSSNYQLYITTYLDSLDDAWQEGTTGKETGLQAPGGDVDTSQLDDPDDKPVVVDPGVLPQLNPSTDAQTGIGDYIELLKQLLNQEADPALSPDPLPAIDPAVDTPVAVPVPGTLPVTPPWTVTLPGDQDAPQDVPTSNTPVTDPDQPADPEITIPQMSVRLDDYFPFCIPFDIYHLLQKFNASPVTPEVHLSFDVPRMNIHIPLDIDLSPFNSVASVARTMETVSYTVGLALITRKTIIRG